MPRVVKSISGACGKRQTDMVLFSGENIFIFEFKIMELSGKGSALSQIKEMKYYEKYISGIPNGKLFLIKI